MKERCACGHDQHATECEVPVTYYNFPESGTRSCGCERMSPDDKQNDGDDDLQPLATSLPTGGSTAANDAAKTDNGVGVTSAGGESGLPHRSVAEHDLAVLIYTRERWAETRIERDQLRAQLRSSEARAEELLAQRDKAQLIGFSLLLEYKPDKVLSEVKAEAARWFEDAVAARVADLDAKYSSALQQLATMQEARKRLTTAFSIERESWRSSLAEKIEALRKLEPVEAADSFNGAAMVDASNGRYVEHDDVQRLLSSPSSTAE